MPISKFTPFTPDTDVEPYGDPTWTPGADMPEITSTPPSPDVVTNMTMTDTPEKAVASAVNLRTAQATQQVHMGL